MFFLMNGWSHERLEMAGVIHVIHSMLDVLPTVLKTEIGRLIFQ